METAGHLNASDLIEECARAIYDEPTRFDGDPVAVHLSNSWMIENSSPDLETSISITRSVCEDAANAVLSVLRKRGLINELGLSLIRESEEKRK